MMIRERRASLCFSVTCETLTEDALRTVTFKSEILKWKEDACKLPLSLSLSLLVQVSLHYIVFNLRSYEEGLTFEGY